MLSCNLFRKCLHRPASTKTFGTSRPAHQGQFLRTSLRSRSRQHGQTSRKLDCRAIFNFGKSNTAEKKYASSMTREEYTEMDVEDYFNYMGMLAAEGNYDRMEKMLETGVAPADLLLLMAASENDAPKVAELLRAGADTAAKDFNGNTAKDLTQDKSVLELLEDREKAFSF